MASRKIFIVESDKNGIRLDKYISSLFSNLGLRGARRLINSGAVSIQERKPHPGLKVSSGDRIEIWDNASKAPAEATLVDRQGEYLFFHKPSGMHTSALAGSSSPSLEAQIPGLLDSAEDVGKLRLLQRLDNDTSGIICGAVGEGAFERYKKAEEEGRVEKNYLAVLDGRLEQAGRVKNLLDVEDRKKVRLLPGEAPPVRWTLLEPLAFHGSRTLARCTIRRGYRHQIRAHASAIGHPLAGDVLYGSYTSDPIKLVCYRLAFPGHDIRYISPDSGLFIEFPDVLEFISN